MAKTGCHTDADICLDSSTQVLLHTACTSQAASLLLMQVGTVLACLDMQAHPLLAMQI